MEVRLLKDVLRQMAAVLLRQRLRLEALQRGADSGPVTPIAPYAGIPNVPRVPPPASPAAGLPVGWSVDNGMLRAPSMAPPPAMTFNDPFLDMRRDELWPDDGLCLPTPSRAGSSGRSVLRPLSAMGGGLSQAPSSECNQAGSAGSGLN